MKKKPLLILLATGAAALALSSYSAGPYAGGAGNHTGSAGSTAGCSTGGSCHAANTANTTLNISILSGTTVVSKYTPGTVYTVQLLGGNVSAHLPRFGFQASCVKAAATSVQAGTFATGGTANIAVRASTPQLIEHTSAIAALTSSGNNNAYSVSFQWTAPAAGTGTVRFFAALNAVNFNGGEGGDQPNVTTFDLPENATGITTVGKDAALNIYPNPAANTVHIRMNGAVAGSYYAAIHNLAGQAIWSEMITPDNNREAAVNVSAFAPGMYYFSVVKDGVLQTIPFVKQ